MKAHDRNPLDRTTAEQLLRGWPGTSPTAKRLASRLAAAAAPALARELAGEQRATAAFRSAQLHPAIPPRRPTVLKSALAKLLTLKAAAIIAVVGAGGVALAATTGVMPNPLGDNPPAPAHSTPGQTHPAGTPAPSLHGLCTAYLAHTGEERGKALDSPAFTALINAAGGKDKVEAFCATLPTPGNETTDHPTGAPTTHDTGAPPTHPTGPDAHPTPPTPTPSHAGH
jgi:hypothetical protein